MTAPELEAERERWEAMPEDNRLYLFAIAWAQDTRRALALARLFGLEMAGRNIDDLREVIA